MKDKKSQLFQREKIRKRKKLPTEGPGRIPRIQRKGIKLSKLLADKWL